MGGPPPVNRNGFIETVNLTQVPQTVTPTVNATLAATATGDWNASGYAEPRDHTYNLDDTYHDGNVQMIVSGGVCCDPSVVGTSSKNATYTKTAPAALNGEVRLVLTAALDFDGDAGSGRMEIDLVYTSCSPSITAPSQQPPASGGTLTVPVTAPAGCAWSASVLAGSPWLTASPATGNGNGTVTLTASANLGGAYRGGVVNVAGELLAVTQAAAGGSGTYTFDHVVVTRTYDSSDAAAANNPIQAGMQTFQGNGLFFAYPVGWDFTYPNAPGDQLLATTERGRFVAFLNFDNVPIAVTPGSNATVGVDMTGDWIAQGYGEPRNHSLATNGFASGQAATTNGDPDGTGFLTFTAPGTAQMVPQPDPSGAIHLTINGSLGFADAGGASITADLVYTAGATGLPTCTFTLGSNSGTLPQGGGTGNFSFTASASSCAWTAATTASFLTITSAASGTGSGTVSFSGSANTTAATRTGTITVGGQTFTVTQPAGASGCTYALSPTGATAPAGGTTGSFSVTTGSGCAWTATSTVSWITVSSSTASGSGNGAVNYTVAANTGSARAWTIMVDGQTYTVSQDGVGGSGAVCNFGNGFSNAVGITLVPSAAYATTSDGTVLRVTPATGSQSGAAYCTSPVQLGNNGTFSTQFQFRFSNPRFRIVYLFRAAEQHQRQPERDCQRWRRVLDHYTGRGWDFGRE